MKYLITTLSLLLSLQSIALNYIGEGTKPTLTCKSLSGIDTEGFSMDYKINVSITNFMGSPLLKSNMKWRESALSNILCLIPYGSKNVHEVRMTREMRGDIYPYQATVLMRITSTAYNESRTLYMAIDPGVLSTLEDEQSFNTPGIKSWDKLFFNIPQYVSTQDQDFLDKVDYLSEIDAKKVFSENFKVTGTSLVNIKYNLNKAKLEFTNIQREKNWKNLVSDAKDFGNWFAKEFKPHSRTLITQITNAFNKPLDESTRMLTDILHKVSIHELPQSLNPTDSQKREFKEFQEKIKKTFVDIEESIYNYNLFPQEIAETYENSNQQIAELMNQRRQELLSNQIDMSDSIITLDKDIRVYLECGSEKASVLLKKGFEFRPRRKIERPNIWFSDVRAFNNSVAYMCQEHSKSHLLKVVDLDSNLLFEHKLNDDVKYYIASYKEDVDVKDVAKVIMIDKKMLNINILDKGHEAYVDVMDAKNNMKLERISIGIPGVITSMISARKNQILSYHYNGNTSSMLKLTNIETTEVATISLNKLNVKGRKYNKFYIKDSRDGQILVHFYIESDISERRFSKSIIIKNSNIIEVSSEEIEKLP